MENKKKVVLIGIGNCGNQIAYLGETKYPDLFDAVYINTSESDLSQVNSESLKYKIGENADVDVEGSGKNRARMKKYLRGDIESILKDEKFEDMVVDKSYAFVIVSAAGGSGSGAGPVFTSLLGKKFPDTNVQLYGVLPNLDNASLLELVNSLEFLDELYTKMDPGTRYALYDNDTVADLPVTVGLSTVNDSVIEDIRVFTGIDNYSTPYESIDDADMNTILSSPGRQLVVRLTDGICAKAMEDGNLDKMLVKAIKNSNHAELDRARKVVRWGLITFLTDDANCLYSPKFPELESFLGTPSERFNHNAVNTGSDKLNFVYLIASGLPPINDRINRYTERIKELKEAMAAGSNSGYVMQENYVKDLVKEVRGDESDTDSESAKVSIDDEFSKFL